MGVVAPQVIVGESKELIVIGIVVVQPPKFIYCIVAIPPETPVTSPRASTVAIAGVKEVHGVEALGNKDPSNCSVPA